jgi:hypothetical protein
MIGCSSEVIKMHKSELRKIGGGQTGEVIQIRVERPRGYGSVPGLDDGELADPEELERQVVLDMWGPILALPELGHRTGFRPVIDESGHRDWGAFGTVDFERLYGPFDKLRYKIDKLREQLRYTVIRVSVLMDRVPGQAKYLVIKNLYMGVIELDQIADEDMQAIGRWALRARRLRQEISDLRRTRFRAWQEEDGP